MLLKHWSNLLAWTLYLATGSSRTTRTKHRQFRARKKSLEHRQFRFRKPQPLQEHRQFHLHRAPRPHRQHKLFKIRRPDQRNASICRGLGSRRNRPPMKKWKNELLTRFRYFGISNTQDGINALHIYGGEQIRELIEPSRAFPHRHQPRC